MPAFLPKSIDRLEAGIAAQARELVGAIAPLGRCEFIEDFARKLPIVAFLKVVDLPIEDRELLVRLADTIMHGTDRAAADEAQAADLMLPMSRLRSYAFWVMEVVAAREAGGEGNVGRSVVNLLLREWSPLPRTRSAIPARYPSSRGGLPRRDLGSE